MTYVLVVLDAPDRNGDQSVNLFWVRRRPVDDETANAWHRARGMEPGELIVTGSCGRCNVAERNKELTALGHHVRAMGGTPTLSDFPDEDKK